MRALLTIPVCLLLTLLLGSCSTLSEKECLTADWQDIGFRDGMAGHPRSLLADHAEACRKVAVEPDQRAYYSGRERGLRQYCTPASGLAAGRRGASYANVCPADLEPGFLKAWEAGHAVYHVRSQLDSMERDRSALEERMVKARTEEERRSIHNQLSLLRSRQEQVRFDLSEREAWAARNWR